MKEYLFQEMYESLIDELGSLRRASTSSLCMLALCDNLPKNVFIELLKAEDTSSLREIVNNSTTPVEYLFDIFHYIIWEDSTRSFFEKYDRGESFSDDYIGTNALLVPPTNVSILKHMVGHKNTPAKLLRHLAHVNNPYVHAFLSQNDNCDKSVIEELLLVGVQDWNVMEPLLDSPHMDGELIYKYIGSIESNSGAFFRKMIMLNSKHKAKLMKYLKTLYLGYDFDAMPDDWVAKVIGWNK